MGGQSLNWSVRKRRKTETMFTQDNQFLFFSDKNIIVIVCSRSTSLVPPPEQSIR